MRVLVTGINGQLGHDVMNELHHRGYCGIGSDITPSYRGNADETPVTKMEYHPLDITDSENVKHVFQQTNPDAVIHCAAWTAVDLAELPENREKVYSVNVKGTENLANACQQWNCKMMYISTDYVFNGQGEMPWKSDCMSFEPLNIYGETKFQGEQKVAQRLSKFFVVRIARVFGANGSNFVKTMLNLAKKYQALRVVNDQIGTPTYTKDLARLLVDMIETEKYGYYHATNEGGYISWAEFAREIFASAGCDTTVIPVSTEEYGESKAKRPRNSRLDRSKLTAMGFRPLPEWKDALYRFLKEIREV